MNFWKKLIIKKIIHLTPYYFKCVRNITTTNKINFENIYDVLTTVPYYKTNPEYLHPKEISNYPLLEKMDIIGKEDLFISQKVNKKLLFKVSTGGTSGKSLNFYKTINDIIKEEAYISFAFSIIGTNLRVGVLRGNRPSKRLFEYKHKTLLLSSYELSLENVKKYVNLINEYKINCLHVYPTSIEIFLKYLNKLKGDIEMPNLKGILSSSEIMSFELKKMILDIFPNITLVDLYSQNEHVAFALSVNLGYYSFYNSYSYVELIETDHFSNENKIYEIVGTNINNKAMPLVRYRTEDFVEIDKNGNIISIIGRSTDFIVNKNLDIIPCMVVTRDKTLENVISFQYYQEKAGQLIFRVVVNELFNENDKQMILDDFNKCFNNLMDIVVLPVDEIEKTKNGKQKRLIQMLNI